MNSKSVLTILLMMIAATVWFAAAAKDPVPITDDSLVDAVRRKLANDPVVKGAAFAVEVRNGVVTLRGKVEQEKQKERATKVAGKVKGVKSVDNQLSVVGKGPR